VAFAHAAHEAHRCSRKYLVREAARRHFLAAAHLELVLAHDYDEAGAPDLALRSRVSAASCLWSGGDIEQGRQALERLQVQYPTRTTAIAEVMAELARDYHAVQCYI
jgi:hypothetical protein